VKHAVVRIHFNLQVVRAASVQKRDPISDTIALVVNVNQQLQASISQGLSLIQGLETQIASATANALGSLQTTASQITAQVASVPICANAETTSATNVVTQAGMLLHRMYQLLVTFTVKSCEYGNEHSASIRTVQYFA